MHLHDAIRAKAVANHLAAIRHQIERQLPVMDKRQHGFSDLGGVFNVDQYAGSTVLKCPRHCAAGTTSYYGAASLNRFANSEAVGLDQRRVYPDIDLAAKFVKEHGVRQSSAEFDGKMGVRGSLRFPACSIDEQAAIRQLLVNANKGT